MRWSLASISLVALSLSLGCSSAPKSQTSDGTSGTNSGGGKGNTAKGGSGANSTGAASNGGGPAQGGSSSTTVEISSKMAITGATARIAGRLGDELNVEVKGTSELGLFASVGVVLTDNQGKEIVYFDSNWDGKLDSGSGRVVPDALPSTKDFTTTVVLQGIAKHSDAAKVSVALFDREGRSTESIGVDIQKPEVVVLGQACDPAFVKSRCRQGFSCLGNPAKCVDGTAPTIARGAFQRGTDGPFMRLRGLDPDEDVLFVRVDFLTERNDPVTLDLDGDGLLDATNFEVQVGIKNRSGGYTFINEAGTGFEKMVPKVGLTAIDSRQNESTTEFYTVTTRLVRQLNQACDIDGFDACVDGTVCLPGKQTGTAFCVTSAQAQSNRCLVAPVWNVNTDPKKLTGVISGYSAWDAPVGCFGTTALGRPEAVVKMRVSSPLKRLTLSTNEPETQIDTGIVVLPSCSATFDSMLSCNDDSQGFTSSLTLSDISAGDYIVIVEAVQSEGGSFALKATVE